MKTSDSEKRVSQRKLEANRRNALRSTGPRTARGKNIVSRNAIKHGLLSSQIVNPELGENETDFHDLHKNLVEEYSPVGQTEHLLVERVATCWWRLRRVATAETGEVTMRIVAAGSQLLVSEQNQFSQDFMDWMVMISRRDAQRHGETVPSAAPGTVEEVARYHQNLANNLRRTRNGLRFVKNLLSNIRKDIEEAGYLRKRYREQILDTVGFELFPILREEDDFRDAEKRKRLLNLIEKYIREFDSADQIKATASMAETEATFQACNLPPDDFIDKMLRYEAYYSRQLYSAMLQLERLQRQRKGESVPAPIRLAIEKG